jgi:hypothetical protein
MVSTQEGAEPLIRPGWLRRIFSKNGPAIALAAVAWAATLPLPVYTVPGPRGGTIYVGSFYVCLTAVFTEPQRVFTEVALLVTVLAVGVLPVLLHAAASLAAGRLIIAGLRAWRNRRAER